MTDRNDFQGKESTPNTSELLSNEEQVKLAYRTPSKRAISVSLLTEGGIVTKNDDGGGGENSYTGS